MRYVAASLVTDTQNDYSNPCTCAEGLIIIIIMSLKALLCQWLCTIRIAEMMKSPTVPTCVSPLHLNLTAQLLVGVPSLLIGVFQPLHFPLSCHQS